MLSLIKCTHRNNMYIQCSDRKRVFSGTKGRTRTLIEIVPTHLLLLFFIASFVVSGDDTNGVRNTFSCLCSLNSGTQFGKCCEQHPIESIELSQRESWSCYANEMKTNERGDLIFLFVVLFFFRITFVFIFPFYQHRDLSSRGITNLGQYCFSSLTNLASLFLHFFPLLFFSSLLTFL